MAQEVPQPIADYFAAANAGDADRIAGCFAADGQVQDEGQAIAGRAAIRAWAVETREKYNFQSTVTAIDGPPEAPVVTARVEGDFPGSPISLRYRFALADGEITQLRIA